MADLKISALTAGGASQATDEYVVARAGDNRKITGANIAAAATAVGTLTSGAIGAGFTPIPNTALANSSITINGTPVSLGGTATISASAAGSNTQVQFNSSGSLAGDSGFTFSSTNKAMTLGGATITANAPVLDLTQTWNNAAVTFTGLRFNVTDTASNAASLLFDLQTGGTSRLSVRKDGRLRVPQLGYDVCSIEFGSASHGFSFWLAQQHISWIVQGAIGLTFTGGSNGTHVIGSNQSFSFASAANPASGGSDTYLFRDAAGIIAQRSGANAQTFRVYNTFTDASNYERFAIQSATYSGGKYTQLAVESAGTGAANQNLVLSPRGTGAFMLQLPDGTTAGGNARGNNAIDLQTVRNNANQVAAGLGSVVIGAQCRAASSYDVAIGVNCAATGSSGVAIGDGCTAGYFAVAMGRNTNATQPHAFATGYNTQVTNQGTAGFGEQGSASGARGALFGGLGVQRLESQFTMGLNSSNQQWSILGFRGETTNATVTEIFLGGTTNSRAVLPANVTWMADIDVIARSSSGTDNACFKRRAIIKRDGSNNTALVGSVQTIDTDIGSNSGSPPAGWAVTITADDTNESLKVEVTGASATTIRWVARVDLVEVLLA